MSLTPLLPRALYYKPVHPLTPSLTVLKIGPRRNREAPAKESQGFPIALHTLEWEWKLFERQEKQVQQLTALCLSLVSIYSSLYRLAFQDDWSCWQVASVAGVEIFLALGLVFAMCVLRIKELVFQTPGGLKMTVENDEYWYSKNLERDRAVLLCEVVNSLSTRRNSIANSQRWITRCISLSIPFVLLSFLAGII